MVEMKTVEDEPVPVHSWPSQTLTLSKQRVIISLTLIVAVVVVVGLLVGFVRPPCPAVLDSSVTSAFLLSSQRGDDENPWTNHRLPEHLVPIHYDLSLYPDFYKPNGLPALFTGNVSIFIQVGQGSSQSGSRHILVHVKLLDIGRTSAALCLTWTSEQEGNRCQSSTPLSILKTFPHTVNEYLVIELATPVQPGSLVVISVEFGGSLTNGITGMYRSRYLDSRNGDTKYLVTTKFQPTSARRAFPCLDEPRFKSTFRVKLIHQSGYTALSNMPPESTRSVGPNLLETTFQESVPMVTYLACFIISEFAYKENLTRRGTPVRIYAAPDKIGQADYALQVGIRLLDFYEDFFGLPYPLPKIDHIAIPDFSSGAMENWGLITYREIFLLFNGSEASPANQQRLATVIAHELAHMWFGNLVTMTWWDDLWLNEGFASYVEYLGLMHVHPDWDMDSQFLVDDLFPVWTVDSAVNSHPIVIPVSHPDQINEVFDSISYSKGASILRMLENFLGMNKFKAGLQSYMKQHQYNSTTTDDLWNSLSEVDGAPNVKLIMDTWTLQMGLPVVQLDVFGNELRLRQERYLLDPNANKTEPANRYKYVWRIPVTWVTSRGNRGAFLLENKEATIDLGFTFNHTTDWIKCNINETSYHRYNYMESNWNALSTALITDRQVFSAGDRAGLIDNAFNLAKASLVDYSVPLRLSLYLEREDHFTPWRAFDMSIGYIRRMLLTTSHYGKWQSHVRRLASPVFKRIGLQETGSHLNRLRTSVVCHLACMNGDQLCLRNMSALFIDWLDNGRYISSGLRDAVYSYAMQQVGDESVWNRVWERYQITTVPQEKNRLLNALAQTRVVWLLNRLLEYALDETKIRDQDFFIAISFIANNPVGRSIVWNWARIHWSRLVDKFSLNNRALGRMIPGIVNTFNTEFQLNEVKSFFQMYPAAGAGDRARKQVLETIKSNIIWMNKHAGQIIDWLKLNN